MPAALAKNRRLVVRVYGDGTRKLAQVGDDCGCCGSSEICGSACDYGIAFPWDGECCVPKTLQVAITATSPGPCRTSSGGGGIYAHSTPIGRLSVSACLNFSADAYTGSGLYIWQSNLIEVSGLSVRVVVNGDADGCTTGGPATIDSWILRIDRAYIIAAAASRPATSDGGIYIRCVSVCGRAYDADGTTRRPEHDADASNLILFDTKPESVTDTGLRIAPEYLLCDEDVQTVDGVEVGDLVSFGTAWIGGTARVKKCCELKEDNPCPDEPATAKWYQAIDCAEGNAAIATIWAREDWLTFTGDRSESWRLNDGTCIAFDKVLSVTRTVPTDDEPEAWKWLNRALPSFTTCELCIASTDTQYIQARDCDGDALLPVVIIAGGPFLTDGTSYPIPGTCLYLLAADAVSDIPAGAVVVGADDLPETGGECEGCEGHTPCESATACVSDDLIVNISGDHGGASSVVISGGWAGEVFDTPIFGTNTSVGLVCSGKYWVLTFSVTTLAGTTCTYTYRKLRLSITNCPGDESGAWNHLSTTGTGCAGTPPAVTVERA